MIPYNTWRVFPVPSEDIVSEGLNLNLLTRMNMLQNPHVKREYHFILFQNPIATVTSVTSKPKSKWRPLPLDTVVRK